MISEKQRNILSKKTKAQETKRIRVSLALLLICIFLITYLFSLEYHTKHTIQNNNVKEVKLQMKKLPKDISKHIEIATPSAAFRVPILIYHYVEIVTDTNDTIRKSLAISPYIFKKQIKTLQDAGYTFITPSDISDTLDGKKILPEKPIILSFDDGYRDFYTDVFPILKEEKIKSVLYVVPGFLDRINYLYTKQLDEIVKSGTVEIGAHTMHHVYLKGGNKIIVEKEISESKKTLEDMYHISVVSFAYPYGAFDTQAADMVKKAGFTTAVSTVTGNEVNQMNRYFLYRIHPGYTTGASLMQIIERNYLPKS